MYISLFSFHACICMQYLFDVMRNKLPAMTIYNQGRRKLFYGVRDGPPWLANDEKLLAETP